MMLYILYNKHSPYEYSDYPTNTDYWADIEYITDDVHKLFHYVNQCRRASFNEFRKAKKHRLDIDDDNPNFDWTGSNYHVLVAETDKQLELDTRNAFEEWVEEKSHEIFTMKKFFQNNHLQLWRPDPESVKQINELIGRKDEDVEDMLKQYKALKHELHNRGYLRRADE